MHAIAKVTACVGLLALWPAAVLNAQESENDGSHLFILSGQSNMVGMDPELSFTPTVAREFGAENIVVVKNASGGQPIHRWFREWHSPGTETPENRGVLYDRLMTSVTAAIADKNISTVTFVWMQGERDARGQWGDVYAASLEGVLQQLANDLGRDDINCVVGRLSDFDMDNQRYRHWTRVREAQVAFAKSRPNRAWVDTDDLNDGWNKAGKPISNDLHLSVEGYKSLGYRFAHKAIDLIKGTRRPNIVLVMADDHGWGDVGYQGHPFVQTPELDRMAREGFVFDRFYAAAPVCSPTRASVLTGRSPIRTRVTNHGRYLRPHEWTLAESLKDAGYVTGIFGKVHLGSGQPDSPCNPTAMGFDEWVIGLNFFDNDPYLSHRGEVRQRQGKGSVIAVDEALAFLQKHKGRQPMFAVVWFPAPHDPHEEIPAGPELYAGRNLAGYYREITLLDQQVGRLRQKLRDLALADNTILWYCSDNGGLAADSSGGRLKKGSIYEGGLRVPSIIEWPAANLQGRTAVPAWTCDILPTVLAMANVHIDFPHPLDGTDIQEIISGKVVERNQPMGFWHLFEQGQATWSDRILESVMEKQQRGAAPPYDPPRMQKDVYEFPQFAEETATGHAAWNKWPWKLHRIDGDHFELYHLEDDPMETTDLSASPEHSRRLEQMKTELNEWMRSVMRSLNGEDYDHLRMATGDPGN